MIRVLIKRNIAPSLEEPYIELAREILQAAMGHEGFIDGEALRDLESPNTRMVLSSWKNRQSWDNWYRSEERKALWAQLTLMLEGEEVIHILSPA